LASAAAISVRPEMRAGGCGDTLSAAGNAFTGRFWSGPGGQLFCPGAEPGQWVFMVDGRCTAELLTCETRTPSAHGDPRALPRLGEEPPVAIERQDTYAARQRKRARTRAALGAPTSSLNNLVLMIQFSDTDVSRFPPLSEYETLFNSEAPADGAAVASASVRALYKHMSFSRLVVNSVLSGWIKVPWSEAEVAGPCQPRRVAQAGDADGLECCNGMGCPAPLTNNMVQVAIKHALTLYERAVGAAIVKQQFDLDGDGVVDCFTVIQSGYGAETTGGDGALARSIWSHKYVLSAADWSAASAKCQGLTGAAFNRCSAFALPLSGILLNDYSISPALWYSGRAGPLKISRVGVVSAPLALREREADMRSAPAS
jgi:M6 family metalloprotease-like protein